MAKIISVALRFPSGVLATLPAPARHSELVRQLMIDRLATDRVLGAEKGFICCSGNFLDRRKACHVALRSGQVTHPIVPNHLHSDDIW